VRRTGERARLVSIVTGGGEFRNHVILFVTVWGHVTPWRSHVRVFSRILYE
jgi:hypothetical protein